MACEENAISALGGQAETKRKRRRPIGKTLRFEVFKRDEFSCQYCGAHPPAAVLEVDHIVPVSAGGLDHMDNLVTACFECNRGKAARSLSAVPKTLAQRAADVAEREAQIAGYAAVMAKRRERLARETWEIVDMIYGGFYDKATRELAGICHFIEKLSAPDTLDAAEISFRRYPNNWKKAFRYFCGICWRCICEGTTPKDQRQ